MKDSIIINMDYAMYDLIDSTPFVERHHCIGGPNRKLADEDGLWVPLTPEHHRTGKDSAHLSKVTHTLLVIIAAVMCLAWGALVAFSIIIGRNPKRFSKRVIRLFFKDGYVKY